MESQYWNDEVQQSAWLLDYDRRCMLDCADTFQNLAAVNVSYTHLTLPTICSV